jgi:hypothetical protein
MVDVRFLRRTDVAAELERLRETPVNYELTAPPTADSGWSFDEYCLRLPHEAPGPPEPDGPYEVACRLVRDYEFADPAIIKAVWLPDSELASRNMLLEGRFLLLRFLLGVRVSAVVDEEVDEDGHRLKVWGWCYRTLSGHLEAGEMCYRVVKELDTGEVQFRVCRYVRSEQIPNPVVRFGWLTFGRAMQVLFVRRSLARMRRLVDAELLLGRHTAGVPLMADRLRVTPEEAA